MDHCKTLPGQRCLNGFALKWIAVVSMTIDHFGSIVMDGVIAPYVVNGTLSFTPNLPWLVYHSMQVKAVCMALGSVAFPIFCFLAAEGFAHTGGRLKYALRLGAFALVSELPFDIAHYGVIFEPKLQNVMFTLAISVFTLLASVRIFERMRGHRALKFAASLLVMVAGMELSYLVRGEYVFLGVAAIAAMYFLRDRKWLRLLGLLPLLVASEWVLLAAVPIMFYDGVRGRGSKYFFYIFYPAHFLALAGLAYLFANF